MLTALRVSKALRLAGTSWKTGENGKDYVECHSCGDRLVLFEETLFCMGRGSCGFRRGTPEDYLVSKVGSSDAAVALAFPSLEPQDRWAAAQNIDRRRALLEFLMDLEGREHDSGMEVTEQRAITGRSGVYVPGNPLGLLFLKATKTGELFGLLSDLDITCPVSMKGALTAAVYWADPARPAFIDIYTDLARKCTRIPVGGYRWGWANLPAMHPECERITTHPTLTQAVDCGILFKDSPDRSFHSRTATDPSGKAHAFLPSELVLGGEETDWWVSIPKWSLLPMFELAVFRLENEHAGLVEVVIRLLAMDFTKTLRMLEGTVLSDSMSARILEAAGGRLDPYRIERITSVLSRRLLALDGRTALYAGALGYELTKNDTTTRVSNFTIDLKGVTGFAVDSELIYHAEMTVGTEVMPLTLPASALESGATLEKAAQSAQILTPSGGDKKTELVSVMDPASFKRVLRYLKGCVPKLPRERGTRLLGWSMRGDEFYSTGYSVSSHGIRQGVRYVPRQDSEFYPFAPEEPAERPEGPVPTNPILLAIVSAAVGNLMRVFHSLPVRPVKIRNDSFGRAAVAKVFSALGQTKPVRLTNLLPRNLADIRGYPVYVFGPSALQSDKVALNGVLLGDSGAQAEGTDIGEAEEAGRFMAFAVAELTRMMLEGETLPFREHRSVSAEGRAASEGSRLLRDTLFPEWPEIDGRYRHIDLLMESRKELLDEAARMAKGEMFIPADLLSGAADVDDLVIEIGLMGGRSALRDGGLVVEPVLFAELYESYHGQPPPFTAEAFVAP